MMTGQSRREKRKEARQGVKQRRNESWLTHQKSKADKFKAKSTSVKRNHVDKSNDTVAERLEKRQTDRKSAQGKMKVAAAAPQRTIEEKRSLKRKPQTGFQEFLAMYMKRNELLAQDDVEVEKRLAKKLKVKDTLLRGMDDGLNAIMEGKPSPFDFDEEDGSDTEAGSTVSTGDGTFDTESEDQKSSSEITDEMQSVDVAGSSDLSETLVNEIDYEEEVTDISSCKKRRGRKKSKLNRGDFFSDAADTDTTGKSHGVAIDVQKHPVDVFVPAVGVKYIAPHLRSQVGNESEDLTQTRRRVRGLLNRLSESNIETITGEMTTIFRSLSRSISTQIISDEVLTAFSGGPRGNKQYAAVFAAFVAGMACSAGMDFSAKFMAAFAKSFEDEYCREDKLSLGNHTLLLSHLYLFRVCSCDLINDFLIMLSKQLTEVDVFTILTVLQCCGMKIRGDDPTFMRSFIHSVQNKVNELKASSSEGEGKIIGKRMEMMLETIYDIKNNKKGPNGETSLHTPIKKWLQKSGVESVLLRGVKWSKLVDPDKKGQWWLPGDIVTNKEDAEVIANRIDKEVLEAEKRVELAKSLGMNTEVRMAICCVIISAEDYVDAFEKLLRLNLPGKQDREIMRVILKCCLREAEFNKYYAVLASRLCQHRTKNPHRTTLMYCIWDQWKELESMDDETSMKLAMFVTEVVASSALSLSVLKKMVDYMEDVVAATGGGESGVTKHLKRLFETLLDHPDEKIVWKAFSRIAKKGLDRDPDLERLGHAMVLFMKHQVVKCNKALASRFKLAKRALTASAKSKGL